MNRATVIFWKGFLRDTLRVLFALLVIGGGFLLLRSLAFWIHRTYRVSWDDVIQWGFAVCMLLLAVGVPVSIAIEEVISARWAQAKSQAYWEKQAETDANSLLRGTDAKQRGE